MQTYNTKSATPQREDSNPDAIVMQSHRTRGARLAKRCIQALYRIRILPRLGVMRIMRTVLGADGFRYASESIARIPGLAGVYQRQAFYQCTLARCGQDVYFGWSSVFSMAEAEVEDRAYIGRFCSIGFARIGEEAMLADHVQILSGGQEHGRSQNAGTMHGQDQTYRRVRIGRGAWIGAGAIVMADVGENSVIGAGAVVSRPIPSNCVAVGVPARIIAGKMIEAEKLVRSTSEHAVNRRFL
jgi:acetyltransferase-like isoleucine patch superfamily enzyme